MSLSAREHARLARELIERCGGLAEAARGCGLSKTVLSTYQNPAESSTMSARAMADLETYCGDAIYSRALADHVQRRPVGEDLRIAACELTEAAALMQSDTREALTGRGGLTPNEADAIARDLRHAEEALDRVRGALSAAEAGREKPHLRSV